MANFYSSVVNAKLAYARALLRLGGGPGATDPMVRTALVEGALLHLHGAWLAFLREIAVNYQLREVDVVVSAHALCNALGTSGTVPSEASELRDLEAEPGSWVTQLLQITQEVGGGARPGATGGASAASRAEGVIAATADASATTTLSSSTVRALLVALVDLIERQRNTMLEY